MNPTRFPFWSMVRFFCIVCFLAAIPSGVSGSARISDANGLAEGKSILCEDISGQTPLNKAVVFSFSRGTVVCFTEFDVVPERTAIFHKWFRKDKLIANVKLALEPPRWSTFSKIQVREADKGPWKVEVTDSGDRLLRILRFSVTD